MHLILPVICCTKNCIIFAVAFCVYCNALTQKQHQRQTSLSRIKAKTEQKRVSLGVSRLCHTETGNIVFEVSQLWSPPVQLFTLSATSRFHQQAASLDCLLTTNLRFVFHERNFMLRLENTMNFNLFVSFFTPLPLCSLERNFFNCSWNEVDEHWAHKESQDNANVSDVRNEKFSISHYARFVLMN